MSHVPWRYGKDADAETFPIPSLLVLLAGKVCACEWKEKKGYFGAKSPHLGVNLLDEHRALAGVRAMSLGRAVPPGSPHLLLAVGDNQPGLKA